MLPTWSREFDSRYLLQKEKRDVIMKIMKKLFISREDGFIVQILFVFFYFAERISIFYWFRKIANAIWIRIHKNEILNDKDRNCLQKSQNSYW